LLDADTSLPHLADFSGVVSGAVLTAAGALLLWPALAVARRLVPEPAPSGARWGFVQLCGVCCVSLVTSLALPLVWPLPEEGSISQLETFLRMLILYLVTGSAIAAIACVPGAGGAAGLGLRRGGHLRGIAMGVSVYLLLLPALLGITFLWAWTLEQTGGEVEPQQVLVGFLELEGPFLAFALVLGIVVLPFGEELCFRGFVQPALARLLGGGAGVVLTSGLFAALHGSTACVPVFALSLILGALMLRTQRLVTCWIVHALHNGLMLLALLAFYEDPESVVVPDLLLP